MQGKKRLHNYDEIQVLLLDAIARAGIGTLAQHVQHTCEEPLDLSWRERIELLLLHIIDRLERIEHSMTGEDTRG